MKTIKEYIVESSNEAVMSQYAKGDKCIYLHDSGLRHQEKITVEVVQINKVTKTLLGFDYLTHFNLSESNKNRQIKYKKSFSNDAYAFTSGMTSTTMIISKADTSKILKLIEKNDYKLDFHNVLRGEKQRKDYMIPVMQLKDNTIYNPNFDDYEKITSETINIIKDILK